MSVLEIQCPACDAGGCDECNGRGWIEIGPEVRTSPSGARRPHSPPQRQRTKAYDSLNH